MKRFRKTLIEINRKLDLPQPDKSRILLEIASDLEEAYSHLVEGGMEPEKAERETLSRFDLSDQVVEELIGLYQSPAKRLLGRISEQARSRLERFLLIATLLVIAVFSGREILSADIFMRSGPFVWPVLAAAAVTITLAICHFYRLYIKKEHAVRKLRAGLSALLLTAGACLLSGIYGTLYEMSRTMARIIRDIDQTWGFIAACGIRCSALGIISILAAIISAVIWYILTDKVRRIEIAEASWLLGGQNRPD